MCFINRGTLISSPFHPLYSIVLSGPSLHTGLEQVNNI